MSLATHCPSCHKHWLEHGGTIELCAQLVAAQATIDELRQMIFAQSRRINKLLHAKPEKRTKRTKRTKGKK